ncbi:Rog3 protein [Maudiozyma humilis]|uniref:Rog3 protein n=1 Tax=Maudiozyma humilis TaxID=51915 RepID=A0AAV5RUJ2_MAUHU|nr:Rog3 protein [Kazachstania humilis]
MQSSKECLIDISVQSGNGEVIILKGPPDEAAPVLLSGVITLHTSETIKVKSVSLKLTGRMTYKVPVLPAPDNAKAPAHIQADRWIFHYKWDNFTIEKYLNGLYSNYGSNKAITQNPKQVLDNRGNLVRPKSTTSLVNMKSTTSPLSFQRRKSHTLIKGKYEFPFTTVLPGDMNETIDGLPNTNLSYYLEAIVERSNGKSDLYCRKYLRIVRTITPDIPEISETVSVRDTWPNRIFYCISVPAKTIAIGSKVPLSISIIPLQSGIKLHTIRVTLYEQAEYCCKGGRSKIDRAISRIKIDNPDQRVIKLRTDEKFQEKWDLDLPFRIPASLSKCTQDCEVFSEIRVTHKFKFVVHFVNPDGHISKLKANIPVHLFISEFVPLKVRTMLSTTEFNCIAKDIDKQRRSDNTKETIFETGHRGLISPQYDNESILPVGAINDLLSPPEYENHVFDRLFWNDMDVESSMLPPPTDIAPELLPYEPVPASDFTSTDVLRSIEANKRRLSNASCQTMPEIHFNSLDAEVDDATVVTDKTRAAAGTPSQVVPNLDNYTIHSPSLSGSLHQAPSYENVAEPLEQCIPEPPSYNNDEGTLVDDAMTPPHMRRPSVSFVDPLTPLGSIPIMVPSPARTTNSPLGSVKSAPQVVRNRASSTSSNNPFLKNNIAATYSIEDTIKNTQPNMDVSSGNILDGSMFHENTTDQYGHRFSEPFEKLNGTEQRRFSNPYIFGGLSSPFSQKKNYGPFASLGQVTTTSNN